MKKQTKIKKEMKIIKQLNPNYGKINKLGGVNLFVPGSSSPNPYVNKPTK